MKRLALLVLALVAAVIADDIDIWAEKFESDTTTVQGCLDESKITIVEIKEIEEKVKNMQEEDDIDEETKEVIVKHNNFIACMLEKKEMMKDSKLILDKILQDFENDKDASNIPSKEILTECVNALNENGEMTRGDRAFGLVLCIYPDGAERR